MRCVNITILMGLLAVISMSTLHATVRVATHHLGLEGFDEQRSRWFDSDRPQLPHLSEHKLVNGELSVWLDNRVPFPTLLTLQDPQGQCEAVILLSHQSVELKAGYKIVSLRAMSGRLDFNPGLQGVTLRQTSFVERVWDTVRIVLSVDCIKYLHDRFAGGLIH